MLPYTTIYTQFVRFKHYKTEDKEPKINSPSKYTKENSITSTRKTQTTLYVDSKNSLLLRQHNGSYSIEDNTLSFNLSRDAAISPGNTHEQKTLQQSIKLHRSNRMGLSSFAQRFRQRSIDDLFADESMIKNEKVEPNRLSFASLIC